MRIAPDLGKELRKIRLVAKEVKNLEDIIYKVVPLVKPAYMPRSNPLRIIFRGINDDELRSVVIMVAKFVLAMKQPLFDERNPDAFQVFKRAIGLPEEWQLPENLLDYLPVVYEQFDNALKTAGDDELEAASTVCREISRILENPENWKRGAIVVFGTPLPWRFLKAAGLLWPSPVVRAVTVALTILVLRSFRRWLEEVAGAVVSAIKSADFPLVPLVES